MSSHGHGSHHGHMEHGSRGFKISKPLALILLFILASKCLRGCVPNTVMAPEHSRVEQIVRQFDGEIATRSGNPPVTINGAFEAVRSTCRASQSACRQNCSALPLVRERIDRWNDTLQESWSGQGRLLEVTWEPDVDQLCASSY